VDREDVFVVWRNSLLIPDLMKSKVLGTTRALFLTRGNFVTVKPVELLAGN
jgi:hypothetical protein